MEYVNHVFQQDNLLFLKSLPDQSIDLIYIDPPFFTQSNFEMFSDVWIDLQTYLAFMRVRIQELYRILKSTGSFYCHLDAHASHYVKIICDEIFGYEYFRSEIIWQNGSISGFKGQKNGWIRDHDIILYYTKSNQFTFNKLYKDYSKTYYDNLHNGRSAKKVFEQDGQQYYERYDGRIIPIGKGIPYSDVWYDIPSFQAHPRSKEIDNSDHVKYDTQKPKPLLTRIIKTSSNPEDIVLDCFCGSGTTLVVAKELCRKYTGCDHNPDAITITNQRLSSTLQVRDIRTYFQH